MKIERKEGEYTAFIGPIVNMFGNSKKFVDMATSLFPDFYNDERVRKAIVDCVNGPVKFRILIDKEVNINNIENEVQWLFALKDQKPDQIRIAHATEGIKHYINVDNKYFRLEGKHKIDFDDKSLKLRNSYISSPMRHISIALCTEFENWWISANKL